MKKTLLLLLLVLPVFVQAQTYTLNYDSVRVGKTPNSSVLIPKDIYLKGLPKGNVSIRTDGKVIHNDTPYVKPADLTIYKRKDDSTGADGYLRRGSLYPLGDIRYSRLTASGYLNNSNAFGTIYSNSNFTSLTGFTQNGGGTIATVSGGALFLANPVGTDLTHTLDIAGSAYSLPNWNFDVTAVVPSSPLVNTQLTVGTRSVPGETHQILAGIDVTASGTSGRLRIVRDNGTVLATSTSNLAMVPGDSVNLTFTRVDYLTFRARAVNITTNNSIDITAFYDSEDGGRISIGANTGYLSLYATTTTPIKIISYTVESNTPKNAQLVIGSDSKWGGYLASAYANTAYGKLSQIFNVVHTSGGGDRTNALIAQLPALLVLKPKVIFLDYSSNDFRNGVPIATTITNLTTAYNTLTAAGIQVWIGDGEYETANDLGPLAAAIRAAFPSVYVPTFEWTKAVGTAGLAPDGYHLSDVDNDILATNVAKYIFNTSLKTPIIKLPAVFVKSGTYSIQRAQPATFSGTAGDKTNMLFKLWTDGTTSFGNSVSANTYEYFSSRDHKFYGSIATPIVTMDNNGLSVAGTGSPIITAISNSVTTNSNASINLQTPDGTLFQMVNWGSTQSGSSLGQTRAGKAYIINNNTAPLVIGTSTVQPIIFGTSNATKATLDASGRLGIGATSPTAFLHLAAGQSAANFAPLKFTSGTLAGTAEVGAVEFVGDKYYATITTGAARKELALNDVALNSGIVPVTTTNGRLTNTTVTGTELGYLSGVTSSLQTQINGKLGTAATAANSLLWNGAAISASAPTTMSGILVFDNTNSQYRLATSTALIQSFLGYPTQLRLTGSGTGAATTISIAHGLSGVTSSSICIVQPINAASAGVSYVTTDATFVNFFYTVAPANGVSNLQYNVSLKP